MKEKALEIDFSAIAKGFAVDYLSVWLVNEGYRNHLVEIGGEVKALGRAPSGEAWRVAIERPGQLERCLYQVVQLTNSSMATSGDYRNFFVADGNATRIRLIQGLISSDPPSGFSNGDSS